MLIGEVKANSELDAPVIKAKAQAAAQWCKAASQHTQACGGKP